MPDLRNKKYDDPYEGKDMNWRSNRLSVADAESAKGLPILKKQSVSVQHYFPIQIYLP